MGHTVLDDEFSGTKTNFIVTKAVKANNKALLIESKLVVGCKNTDYWGYIMFSSAINLTDGDYDLKNGYTEHLLNVKVGDVFDELYATQDLNSNIIKFNHIENIRTLMSDHDEVWIQFNHINLGKIFYKYDTKGFSKLFEEKCKEIYLLEKIEEEKRAEERRIYDAEVAKAVEERRIAAAKAAKEAEERRIDAEKQIAEAKKVNEKNVSLAIDVIKRQILECWSVPLGLPYGEDLIVRIKLKLNRDGSVINSEILDLDKIKKENLKVLAESALRATKLCQPLKVPPVGYGNWKELILNFDARELFKDLVSKIDNLKITVRQLNKIDIEQRKLPNETTGLVITNIDKNSPVNYLNIDDVIVEAKNKKIKTHSDLKKIIKEVLNSYQKNILLGIYNNQNEKRYFGVKLD